MGFCCVVGAVSDAGRFAGCGNGLEPVSSGQRQMGIPGNLHKLPIFYRPIVFQMTQRLELYAKSLTEAVKPDYQPQIIGKQ